MWQSVHNPSWRLCKSMTTRKRSLRHWTKLATATRFWPTRARYLSKTLLLTWFFFMATVCGSSLTRVRDTTPHCVAVATCRPQTHFALSVCWLWCTVVCVCVWRLPVASLPGSRARQKWCHCRRAHRLSRIGRRRSGHRNFASWSR
jgi:hypothetical protein